MEAWVDGGAREDGKDGREKVDAIQEVKCVGV
jgi:hypothetical protein